MDKDPFLEPKHEEMIRTVLAARVPDNEVWMFGSRAGGAPKPHSDVDLVVIDDPAVPENLLAALKLDFEESNLPFRVDVVLWSGLAPAFRQLVDSDHIVFSRKEQIVR